MPQEVEAIEAEPVAGAKTEGNPEVKQDTVPEQKAEVAHPDGGDEDDQSKVAEVAGDDGEKLTDDQKTIKKLQRRIERLNGKVGGTSRERDMLREQLGSIASRVEDDGSDVPKGTPADIERLANERAREMVHMQSLNDKADALLKAGRKVDGFDEAVRTLREEVKFTDGQGRVTPFLEAVLESDNPARLVKYLGDNPDEAADLESLTPAKLGRQLAKLENTLEQESKVKVSKAPPPIEPINGAGSHTQVNLKTASMDEYVQLRRKQGAPW